MTLLAWSISANFSSNFDFIQPLTNMERAAWFCSCGINAGWECPRGYHQKAHSNQRYWFVARECNCGWFPKFPHGGQLGGWWDFWANVEGWWGCLQLEAKVKFKYLSSFCWNTIPLIQNKITFNCLSSFDWNYQITIACFVNRYLSHITNSPFHAFR